MIDMVKVIIKVEEDGELFEVRREDANLSVAFVKALATVADRLGDEKLDRLAQAGAGCRCDGCDRPTSLHEWELANPPGECTATWVDDWGKDHACMEDPGHVGGHECGCGARVPQHLLDLAARLARAVAWVADLGRPLTTGGGTNEREALRTLAADAHRAGLLDQPATTTTNRPTEGD